MQHIVDLRAEAADLHELLAHLPEADWATPTQFKGWTINDVIIHLHAGDLLAAASVRDAEVFGAMLASIRAARQSGLTSIEENRKRIGPLSGARLLEAWRSQLDELCTALASKDPDARLTWAGPDMGVRMFTTARQMEIWAHGQEVYDVLGEERASTDRLKSIAVIGVRTYGWTVAGQSPACPAHQPFRRSVDLEPAIVGQSRRRVCLGFLSGRDPGPQYRRHEARCDRRTSPPLDGYCPVLCWTS
jgi:uncharacterized protein (TIGR03084 family)